MNVAKVPRGKLGLRWDLKSERWERVGKTWYPDDRPKAFAWTQVLSKIGAVEYAGARGAWLAVWHYGEDNLPRVEIFQTFPSREAATTYALGAIGWTYANKYAGDYDLRVVLFTRDELQGFDRVRPEGYAPLPPDPRARNVKYAWP